MGSANIVGLIWKGFKVIELYFSVENGSYRKYQFFSHSDNVQEIELSLTKLLRYISISSRRSLASVASEAHQLPIRVSFFRWLLQHNSN